MTSHLYTDAEGDHEITRSSSGLSYRSWVYTNLTCASLGNMRNDHERRDTIV